MKSRYSVWPSAYASGALVKCRKVGAANWGNSTKKEEYVPEEMDGKLMPSNPKFKGVGATKKSNPIPERTKGSFAQMKRSYFVTKNESPKEKESRMAQMKQDAADDKKDLESAKNTMKTNVPAYDSRAKTHSIVNSSKPGQTYNFTRERLGAINKKTVKTAGKTNEHYDWRETLDEKCWKGYEKKGMKTMFGKRYPNCVKKTKKEELEVDASSLDEKLVHGNFGNFIKGQKLDKKKEKKYTKPPYEDLAASVDLGDELTEKTMTASQKRKDTMLKKKYDDSDMKKNMIAQYGKEEGTKIYFAKIRKEAMKEDITDEALTIQDWNVDDIKFTEIETVDIIKAKPLKENTNLDEGAKRKIIKKIAKQIVKQLSKKKPKITGDVKKYVPPSKEVVQNIQTKSIVNQVKKASDLSSKPVKGTTPVKVDVSKPINFDKYFGGSPTKSIKKKFGSNRPTGTFTDDAPKVKREPLIKAKKGEAEETEKLIKKYKLGDKIEKKYPGRENAELKKKMYKRLFKDHYNMNEGVGLLMKGSGKLIPALMTGIGAVGTMMQSKKKLDPMDFGKSKRSKKEKKDARSQKQRVQAIYNKKKGVELGNELKGDAYLKNLKKEPKDTKIEEHYDWREDLGEDWQKVNRKDKTDGMSKKAVKAYRKENPGSKLKTAVTKDPKKLKKGSKSAKRRLSFCRRMKGMKKKLTSAKTSRDPNSRINKALRRWNC